MRRATLSVVRACSNACVFCAHPGSSAEEPEPIERVRAMRDAGASAITFVGGEPTLAPDLLEGAVRAAREAGFAAIGAQTNGLALAEHARGLAAAGLTDVHVSLHGPDSRSHDYHTGSEGSFERLWAGVAAARSAGLRVVATTVLTRSSFRILSAMPLLLQARGIAAWHVAVPLARGRAQEGFDRVYPRLALALPFALHALEVARRLGLPGYLSGAPLCLLGPLAARSILGPEQPGTRSFGAPCDGCAARASCPGLDPMYLARFGGDELRARDDRPPTADDEPLASLFVGAGELAPRRDGPVHEPSHRARKALPMYGRPQRAQREVATRAAKTGEALREILPALFEPARPASDGGESESGA